MSNMSFFPTVSVSFNKYLLRLESKHVILRFLLEALLIWLSYVDPYIFLIDVRWVKDFIFPFYSHLHLIAFLHLFKNKTKKKQPIPLYPEPTIYWLCMCDIFFLSFLLCSISFFFIFIADCSLNYYSFVVSLKYGIINIQN